MKRLQLTSQFKKDLKRYKHQQAKIDKLEIVLNLLAEEKEIPVGYRPHLLTGNYRGYMECHIENDLLLIWYDKLADAITLVRFGSHSEVF
mgnify:CR=1 FL=1|jgi:addiction module toxin, RelE/StbE family